MFRQQAKMTNEHMFQDHNSAECFGVSRNTAHGCAAVLLLASTQVLATLGRVWVPLLFLACTQETSTKVQPLGPRSRADNERPTGRRFPERRGATGTPGKREQESNETFSSFLSPRVDSSSPVVMRSIEPSEKFRRDARATIPPLLLSQRRILWRLAGATGDI